MEQVNINEIYTFARKFGDKYGKKVMDTATKTGIDATKATRKRVVKKTAEATGDLIGTISVTDPNDVVYDKKLAFKNNATFISCISKINDALIANAEDLDIVTPMYNLIEYSKNYSKTSGSSWNYYRDESDSSAV